MLRHCPDAFHIMRYWRFSARVSHRLIGLFTFNIRYIRIPVYPRADTTSLSARPRLFRRAARTTNGGSRLYSLFTADGEPALILFTSQPRRRGHCLARFISLHLPAPLAADYFYVYRLSVSLHFAECSAFFTDYRRRVGMLATP